MLRLTTKVLCILMVHVPATIVLFQSPPSVYVMYVSMLPRNIYC